MQKYILSGFPDNNKKVIIIYGESIDWCFNNLREVYGNFTGIQGYGEREFSWYKSWARDIIDET